VHKWMFNEYYVTNTRLQQERGKDVGGK